MADQFQQSHCAAGLCPKCGSREVTVRVWVPSAAVCRREGRQLVVLEDKPEDALNFRVDRDAAVRCQACDWRGSLGELDINHQAPLTQGRAAVK